MGDDGVCVWMNVCECDVVVRCVLDCDCGDDGGDGDVWGDDGVGE